MTRLLIVSRIVPGTEEQVAKIFAESDAGGLPALTGVRHRSLYCLHDVCIHLMETDVDPGSVGEARTNPLYLRVNERLAEHTSPYLPTWRSPGTRSPGASTAGTPPPRRPSAPSTDPRKELPCPPAAHTSW